MRRPALWWLLTIPWAAQIFFSSTRGFSGEVSSPLLARILAHMDISLSQDAFSTLHTVFRKSAHVIEYGLFGFLLYASFRSRDRNGWQATAAWRAVAAAVVYSLTDEFHQSFVPNRGASLVDCCLDVSGAVLAILLVYLGARLLRKTAPQPTGN